ncbi:MAG TPA: 2-phosphosulfolactate phosphatase [bacterium]
MKIEIYFTPQEFNEERLKDQIAVVVDVLRSSTTICAAMAAGAKEIIPAESVSSAIELASNLSKDAILLCGEREGKLVQGFHLGNSPLEYTSEAVKGKTLIFGSTNGSPTMVKTRLARRTLISAFVNQSSVVDSLAAASDPIHIICAGKLGQFALEDAVCAGYILSELQARGSGRLELSDAATAALLLFQQFKDSLADLVAQSHHGRYLAGIGMEADLPFCAEVNRIPVLPVYKDGKIRLIKEKASR